ncbi:MAG: restriction endonuclease [Gammaproteobacteria bacterium]
MSSSEWILFATGLLIGLSLLTWKRPGRHAQKIKASYRVLNTLERLAHQDQAAARQFGYLRRIDPFVFEEVVLSALEKGGHRVQRNRRYTGDGGLDGQCWIEGEHYLLQMKRYAQHINPQHVNAFQALCRSRQSKGLFIHTGKTGKGARVFNHSGIKIISGNRLLRLLLHGRVND